jgi:hypothetical protein
MHGTSANIMLGTSMTYGMELSRTLVPTRTYPISSNLPSPYAYYISIRDSF